MTFRQLSEEMTSQEFELWMGLELARQDECPNCGVEPRDMMKAELLPQECPICKHKWARVRRLRGGRVPSLS